MAEYLLRALGAAFLIAALCGPMGCFVVWRHLAYFGEAIAHAAILGVSLSILLEISDTAGLVTVALGAAGALAWAEKRRSLPPDTILGVFAHGSLALGLTLVALSDPVRLDIMGYLFGDVLAISWHDLAWMGILTLLATGVLYRLWPVLLAATIAEDIAKAEGLDTHRARLMYMFLLAIIIAFAAKVVGLLLVTAMLIIPAATARPLATSPESMALFAIGLGGVSSLLGLGASLQWDIPTGPAIVASSFILFGITLTIKAIKAIL